ncbi:uncharacterized protein N7469_002091 [Penicillium citrinum]|uniref:Ribonuclease H1 N-terminal domain-containing protein n=1 Tax=Penicillium citrinum TaxID=5077 RepID=A0A9W9P9U7_PENCI|nr:uncharacterized protein N7469_002091 [Penicillium citrinum]KAJ5240500.1 hypothetical protein N7469_002091 [Penicillium citrinum]
MARERYYAVSRGRAPAPGIFLSWTDVEPLISRYPGNQHAFFPTLDEAVEYLAEHGVPEGQRVVVSPPNEIHGQARQEGDGSQPPSELRNH